MVALPKLPPATLTVDAFLVRDSVALTLPPAALYRTTVLA